MLDIVKRGRRRAADTTSQRNEQPSSESNSAHETASLRTQWTVKGIDKRTLELSRLAARKRGMTFGAWVNQALRDAASGENGPLQTSSNELMTKIAEIEHKLNQSVDELKQQSNHIQHDVRVLHLLVPKAAN